MSSCNEDLERFKQRARSLLVVVSSEPSENYTKFMEEVRASNEKAPFNFTTPKLFIKYDKVSVYRTMKNARAFDL